MASHPESQQQAIVDWAYRGAPQGQVPYPSAASDSAALYSTETQASGTAAAGDLAEGGFRARLAARLLPDFAMPEVGLVAQTFLVGWEIGSGLNAKFLHIGIPAGIPYTGYQGAKRLYRVRAGDQLFGVTVPKDGYVFGYDNGRTNFYLDLATQEPRCDPYGVLQPPSDDYAWMPGTPTNCSIGLPYSAEPYHGHGGIFFRSGDKFVPRTPGKDFDPSTDQPTYTSPAPPAPDLSTARSALAQALDGDGSDTVRDEIDWRLTPGHQEKEEPIKIGAESPEDQACKAKYGDAMGPDPGKRAPGAMPTDPDAQFLMDTYTGVADPYNPGQSRNVQLKWGTRAWGERHIILDHGFGYDAQQRTRAALETDRTPLPDAVSPSDSYDYFLPLAPAGSVPCRQKVVVTDHSELGVVTSYVEVVP